MFLLNYVFLFSVLIPLVSILGLSIIIVTIILCRFYVWKKVFPSSNKNKDDSKHKYSKLSNRHRYKSSQPISGSRKPPFLFIQEEEQTDYNRVYNSLSTEDDSSLSWKTLNVTTPQSAPWKRNGGPLSPYSDASTTELFHFDETRPSTTLDSEYDGNFPDLPAPKPGKLSKKMRKQFLSEPALNFNNNHRDSISASYGEIKKKAKRSKSARTVVAVAAPIQGEIQFTLHFNPDERTLTIQLAQLTNIVFRPESFIGLLDIVDRGTEHTCESNLFLLRNTDGTFELSGTQLAGYSLCVTLLPKRNFQKQTNIVVGVESAVFNEKFVIHGQTHESILGMYFCIHALCKLGRESDPIVIGEVNVPLKHLQPEKILPFSANLELPEEQIVLEVKMWYLKFSNSNYCGIYFQVPQIILIVSYRGSLLCRCMTRVRSFYGLCANLWLSGAWVY